MKSARLFIVFVFVAIASLILVVPDTLGQEKSAAQPKLDRLEQLTKLPASEWRAHEGDVLGAEDENFDDSSWPSVSPEFHWTSGSAWFRRTIEVPASLNGYDLTGATIYFQFQAWGSNYPLTIYANGSRVAMGEDLEPILLFPNAQPKQKIVIAVKAPSPPGSESTFHVADLLMKAAGTRPDPGLIRAEILADQAMLRTIVEDQAANLRRIDSAIAAINTDALDRGDQATFDASLRNAQAELEPLRSVLGKYTIHATGNAHIDMAWLWPWTETVEVVRNTYGTSLQLMDEYPEYTFTQSTAQASEWLEEKYPELFERIKKRVQEGRWELVGGMWVEPDLNMPDGESLVRQLLVGKNYFKEKFGKDVRIGWNPDSFGYNWQLPQIYKKSGVDFFVTQKMEWNETNKPTKKLFWWQSPDGSRVLTYFPHDYVNQIDPVRMADDFTDARKKVPGTDEMMHLYGIGDHGGGPTRWMLDNARKWESPSVVYPHFVLGTAQQFFDDMEKKAPSLNLLTWNSELYFEFHRGVFTSQAETKKRNRQSEELLLNTEKFSSLAFLAGDAYPGAALLRDWKKVLFNQFHDVAAGSGIAVVYKDAARDYEEVRNSGNAELHRALGTLATYADTSGSGPVVLVFNPLAWDRNDVVETDVQMPGPTRVKFVRVSDATGHVVPVEILASKPETNFFTIRFLATQVPSLGYKVFHVGTATVAPMNPRLIANAGQLENEFLRVKIDSHSGCITSLVDKTSKREVIAPGGCGNLLQAFHDLPKEYDAWNIDADFEDQKWDIKKAEEVRLIKRGPLEAVVRVVRKFQSSTFVQDIVVTAGVPYVSVRTNADWHEKHILLKAAFPLNVHNDVATYEIPYGSIERPTTRRNSIEKAQFEVPALRWADLSDSQQGFSLLNDCKYGYDGKDNVLRLSLLRSPASPDPNADEGKHEFTYALYPHAGDWKQAQTVRRGYELNYKLMAMQVEAHSGMLGTEHSYLKIEPENVVLTAWKKAEGEDSLILRFYEWAGKQGEVRLQLPAGVNSAAEANLMERPSGNLPLENSTVRIQVKPYEIKTVRLRFTKANAKTNAENSVDQPSLVSSP